MHYCIWLTLLFVRRIPTLPYPNIASNLHIWSVHSLPGNRPHDLGVSISGYLGVSFFQVLHLADAFIQGTMHCIQSTHWSVPGNGTHKLIIELQECSIFFITPFVSSPSPEFPFLIQYGPFLGWFGCFGLGLLSGPHGTSPAELGGKALQVSVESQRPSFTEL